MFDARLRPLIDPPLNAVGRSVARWGMTPNGVTLVGVLFALGAFGALASREYGLALALILVNRLLDGLDGAVARAAGSSDFGGFLDIVADFLFYVAVPVGFAVGAPANPFPALLLVAAFTLTGISFLAFATLAAKRGLETAAHGRKSFFYNTGLAEGTETIAVFCAMCLWPDHFAALAYAYAVLCGITVIQRTVLARRVFGN